MITEKWELFYTSNDGGRVTSVKFEADVKNAYQIAALFASNLRNVRLHEIVG